MSYIPNLDIDHGKYSTKSADNKQSEHHQILTEVLQELQESSDEGGVNTNLGGRIIVLKSFVLFIAGNTARHNGPYGNF